VFRTGGLYIVGAWALLQVADLALESMGLAGELLRYFWYAAFAGFPIALIFGWYYEITADGIRKTLPADSSPDEALPMGVPDYVIIVALAVVVAIGAAGLFDQARQAEELAGPFDPNAIAVLPLEDLSGGEDQAYFSAGMHDALIASLSKISALRVVSRNSALRLDRSMPMSEIGRILRARNIIEGSVTREGNRVRVIIQLVDAAKDTQIWAANFEREFRSVLSLQSEMAKSIASAVNVQLTDEEERRLARTESVDPDIYDRYLRGMYLLTQPDNRVRRRGIRILEALVDEGRADARVYAALAFGYAVLGHSPFPEGMYPASKEAAQRALELDDSIPEIYLALGMHELYYEWDFDAAEAQLQRALDLNPSLTATVYHYAWLMELWQYSDKALPLGDKTAELDPLSPYILFTLAEQYRNAGQYDEAIRIADEALAINAQHVGALATKGASIARQGDFETALEILEPIKNAPAWGARYGAVLALAGREQEARAYLDSLEKTPRNVLALVFVYAALGDTDEVFYWMNVAREVRLPWYPWFITWFPNMDPMRNDPRMDDLAAELELTDALARARALGR
jgi:TolB-like protein/Tfp pilus assembly protein PilF